MTLQPGTQVSHPTHGDGTVVDRTAHTHPEYDRVEFTVRDYSRTAEPTRQVRLRVRRDLLTVLTEPPQPTATPVLCDHCQGELSITADGLFIHAPNLPHRVAELFTCPGQRSTYATYQGSDRATPLREACTVCIPGGLRCSAHRPITEPQHPAVTKTALDAKARRLFP